MREFFVALALCHTVQADAVVKDEKGIDESDRGDGSTMTNITTSVFTYQVSQFHSEVA